MRLPLALATLLALAACATTPSQCLLHPLGALPMRGDMPFVPVLIQNHPATLLVDTGAARSVLNDAVVQADAMKTHDANGSISGVGGIGSDTIVTVPSLTIGYATGHDVQFYDAFLHAPGPNGHPMDGMFGADFLDNYDVLIDLPSHRVGLYQTEGCATASFAPLGATAVSMPFGLTGQPVWINNRVIFTAKLNGVAMHSSSTAAPARLRSPPTGPPAPASPGRCSPATPHIFW